MNESTWLSRPKRYGIRLLRMLEFLRSKERNRRRLRLFACACCRRVWDLLSLDAARRVVELVEAYADGHVSEAELAIAYAHPDLVDLEALLSAESGSRTPFSARAIFAIEAARFLAAPNFFQFNGGPNFVVGLTSRDPAYEYFPEPGWYRGGQQGGCGHSEAEYFEIMELLRDIFGNPFRRVPVFPEWRSANVVEVASWIYESRDFTALPVLADALQDAGCNNQQILSHCRGPGPHVRGCWVVDAVFGRACYEKPGL